MTAVSSDVRYLTEKAKKVSTVPTPSESRKFVLFSSVDMPDISEVPISKSDDIPSHLTASGATKEDTAVPSSTCNQIPSAKKTSQCKFCKQQYLHNGMLITCTVNKGERPSGDRPTVNFVVKGNQVKVPLQLHFIVFSPPG